MAVNKPLPATPSQGTDDLGFFSERPLTARNKVNKYEMHEQPNRFTVALKGNEEYLALKSSDDERAVRNDSGKPQSDHRKPKHPPVQPTYYNSRLAPLRSNSSLPLAYHGEYQGVPLLEEAVATPVIAKRRNQLEAEMAGGFKQRGQSRPESESESADQLHIKAVILAEQKPKSKTKSRQKGKSKQRYNPRALPAPEPSQEPGKVLEKEKSQDVEQKQEQEHEHEHEQKQKQKQKHEHEPHEQKQKQKQKHEHEPVEQKKIESCSVAAHKPSQDKLPVERPKTSAVHTDSVADEMPRRPKTSHAPTRKAHLSKRRSKSSSALKESSQPLKEKSLPPIVARPATANQQDKQDAAAEKEPAKPLVPRQRPQTSVALSSSAAAEPEHVQARKRPGTAAPAVTAATINAKPHMQPETDTERMRPATTGQLDDPVGIRPLTKSQRKTRSRPTTSQMAPRPRTATQNKRDRRFSEWRAIHVQSLSRVDSILREAVGLDAKGTAGGRWSALLADAKPLPPINSGLGITINGAAGRTTQQRPETTYARMSTLRQRDDKPLEFLDHQDQKMLSKSLQDTVPRPHTTDATVDCQPAGKRPVSGKALQRANSMRPAGSRRPATSHAGRRQQQMSMYGSAARQIQLSRDESRRSRLFAEYEKLVGSKAHEDVDDEEGRTGDRSRSGLSTVSAVDQLEPVCNDGCGSSESAEATPKASLDNIAEEDEENSVVPDEPKEEVVEGRRAMEQPFRERPPTVHVRSSAELVPNEARLARRHSAANSHDNDNDNDNDDEDDALSVQQSQKRWTRMISMNQHLFKIQAIDNESTEASANSV
ncbi:hypothetical protein FB639_000683, partial [Coemansia asiatica]